MNNILFLNKESELGGAEFSLVDLIQGILKHDFRPIVVLGSDGPLRERIERLDVTTYIFPLDFIHSRNPIPFMHSVSILNRVIKKEKVDLIHSNTLWDNQYGVVAARLASIPHILHVRGFSERMASWKFLYKLGTIAICNSVDTKRNFLKYSSFRKRTEVLYNAVDTDRFIYDQKSRLNVRQSYGIELSDFVIGMAGRLVEEKGQLFLLKTMLPMLKENSNYKILIAGDAKIHPGTNYPQKISCFIKQNRLDRRVALIGFIEDMNGFYNALDLFLLPSFREPFGRVLIEALATETPIIASRVGGVPEVIDHEIDGYLVEPGDANGWRDCINRLVYNESIRRKFVKSGRIKVLDKFTLEDTTSRIVSLYRELLSDY